jgi:nucleotide-binding universal stress UspA family protein
MSERYRAAPSVVVGIDGSRSAVDAAMWAVDEAVGRDIPLRLLYAIDPAESDPRNAARDLATAEIAIRYAFTAVESTERPVKIEVEILQDTPVHALTAASTSAVLVCMGAAGFKASIRGRVGSTTSVVATSAHCPVVVVRGRATTGCILVEVDDWPASDAALQHGIDEARLRGAPLRVLTPGTARGRSAQAQLDRRVAVWRRRYPDLDVQALATRGSTLDYLREQAGCVQLVVVGAERSHGTGEMIGSPGVALLHGTDCSVLSCDRQCRL